MAPITNAQLKQLLDALAVRVSGMETRMDALEKQAMPTLRRVDDFFTFLHKALRITVRCLIWITAAVLTQFIAWLIFHLLGH